MANWQIRPAGDSALVVEFESRVEPAINARAIAFADAIRSARHPGVRDIVSAFCSVTIYFDPIRTDLERLTSRLMRLAEMIPGGLDRHERMIQVPVVYGGEYGPDLQGGCAVRAVYGGRGGEASHGIRVPGLHAWLPAWLRVHRPRRFAHRHAASGNPKVEGAGGISRNCWSADRRLSHRVTRGLAPDRSNTS